MAVDLGMRSHDGFHSWLPVMDRDYCSYSPVFPEHMRLFVKRIERDDKRLEEISGLVIEFLIEIDEKMKALAARYGDADPHEPRRPALGHERAQNILSAG